jgi:N-acetylglucosaminyl-diphospho-decaprenol L-rhamnosyltransferase
MRVAVAIVGYRNSDDLARCIAALEASTYQDYQVVICENGGEEAYQALQRCLPASLRGGQPLRLIRASYNLGYAGGVNVCLAATPEADAWWVLNPDTEPYPDAMARLVARLGAGDCQAVGSTLHLPSGKVQSHGGRWEPWLARAVSIGHGSELDGKPDPAAIERRQNYLNGASMMVGRRFLEAAGPMREDYFLYCEEVEWCLRARRAGMRLGFAEDALILHHQGTTTGNSAALAERPRMPVFLNERNKILLTRDVYPAALPIIALSSATVCIVRYARRRAWRQLSHALAGWRAGMRNERGPLREIPSRLA